MSFESSRQGRFLVKNKNSFICTLTFEIVRLITVEIIIANDDNFLKWMNYRYKTFPFLQSLSHCEQISDDGIHRLGAGHNAEEYLEVLELDNCPSITDTALYHLR